MVTGSTAVVLKASEDVKKESLWLNPPEVAMA